MIAPLKSGLEKFPKISPEKNQVRFCTDYVEVITKRLEPYLNHVPRNQLIINVFNGLHREVKVASTKNTPAVQMDCRGLFFTDKRKLT